jgi:hypothetical protein
MTEPIDTELLADSADLKRKAEKENPPTIYVVLGRRTNGWSEEGRMEAASAAVAIRKILAGNTSTATELATFVAVPARSWQPVTVKTEQKTITKLEPA